MYVCVVIVIDCLSACLAVLLSIYCRRRSPEVLLVGNCCTYVAGRYRNWFAFDSCD